MESALVNSQVQRWRAHEFFESLQVQRDGPALRGSSRTVAQENADSRRGLPPASGCDPLGARRARARRARSQASSGVWRYAPRGPSRGRRGRSAFLGTVFRSGGRAGAGRIPIQGADRCQAKVGRKGFRQPRFFRGVRQEKDERDSQGARLRYGGVLGRDSGWTGEAESEGENVEAEP